MNIDQVKALALLINRIPRLEDFAMMREQIETVTLAPDGVVDEIQFPNGKLTFYSSGIQCDTYDASCYVLTCRDSILGIFPNEELPL